MDPAVFIPLILAGVIMLHHYRQHDRLFDWSDIDSHEAIVIFLIGLWLGLLIK